MKKFKLLLISMVFIPFSYLYGADISFSEALESLYTTHESIAASEAEYKQKQYVKKASLGLYSPRISINATYTYFGNDLKMDVDLSSVTGSIGGLLSGLGSALNLPSLPISLPSSMEQVIQDEQFFTLNASMVWPIFTGGKIYAANKAASANLEIAKHGRTIRHDELGISLAEKYFTLRFIRDIISLKQDVKESMQEHYEKALKLEKAGMIAKVERLHAEMALSEAEKSLDISMREATLVASALKSMISSNDDDINPTTPLFIVSEEDIENLMYFQDMALSNNARLKQVQATKELAGAGVINSTSSFIPKINAFGMVNIYDYQLTSLAPDYMIGLMFSFNLFDGLQNYHQLKASKHIEESVKLMSLRAEKDIKTLVEQQYITMQNARADYNASLKSLVFTEEYLRARQKAFNQGMATSLDVVDAELALSNSKMAAIQAAYKFDMALVNMLATAGIFDSFEIYKARAYIEPGLK